MKRTTLFIAAMISAMAFVLLLLLLKLVDVQAIGPSGTSIGLASLNKGAFELFGTSEILYKLTKWAIVAPIGVAIIFAIAGLVQAIKRGSLFKVDKEILLLAGLYVAVAAIYLIFEFVVINYRPVLMAGESKPEASFPSTHALLSFSIIGSGTALLPKYLKNKPLLVVIETASCAVMLFVALGRLLAGVHWLTDILGGALISLALIFAYMGLLEPGKNRE